MRRSSSIDLLNNVGMFSMHTFMVWFALEGMANLSHVHIFWRTGGDGSPLLPLRGGPVVVIQQTAQPLPLLNLPGRAKMALLGLDQPVF